MSKQTTKPTLDQQLTACKSKQPKTTVTVWDEHRKHKWIKSSYTFNGLPDVDRVIEETLDEGALAVRIECDKEFRPKRNYCLTNDYVITLVDLNFATASIANEYAGLHIDGESIPALESAIIDYLFKQSKRTKQPSKSQPKYPVGTKLLWTGYLDVHKHAESQEATVTCIADWNTTQPIRIKYEDQYTTWVNEKNLSPLKPMYVGKVWILEQPDNPWDGFEVECVREDDTYKAYEQWACIVEYMESSTNPKEVTSVEYPHKCKITNHSPCFIIRCINPEFWTGDICGVNVRCYKDAEGDLRIVPEKCDHVLACEETFEYTVWIAAIEREGIPIMPYEQSQGQYDPPKGE